MKKSKITKRKQKKYRKKPLRIKKNIANNTYAFKRFITTFSKSDAASASMTASYNGNILNLAFGAAAPQTSGYYSVCFTHTLADIANYSEFTSLFDQYKIVGVKISIVPLCNSVNTGDASSAVDTASLVYQCLDFDDGSPFSASLTGIQDIQQRANFRRTVGYKSISRYYKPRILMLGTVSAGGQNAINPKAQWTDCGNANVVHYGSKFIFQVYSNSVATVHIPFDIQMQYYVLFKGAR